MEVNALAAALISAQARGHRPLHVRLREWMIRNAQSVEDVAAALGYHPRTVRRLLKSPAGSRQAIQDAETLMARSPDQAWADEAARALLGAP